MHADAGEVVCGALDDALHAPLARVVGRDVVAELGVQVARQVDEVLALVAVLGRLLAAVARVQRVAEGRELVAGVVEVVLAVHLRALRRQQVRDRVADRDPAPAARVQRPGGVGRDELEVDPLRRRARPRCRTGRPRATTVAQHVVQPRGREVQVDEAGLGGLGPGEMRHVGGLERGDDPLGDVHRVAADGLLPALSATGVAQSP